MEEKNLTKKKLLEQINIWFAQGYSHEDIVRTIIAECLIDQGIIQIQKEVGEDGKETNNERNDAN